MTFAYFEWSAEPDSVLDDREAWEQANPGMRFGRPSEEYIDTVERQTLADETFARERLGIFPEQELVQTIPAHDWRICLNKKTGADPGWMLDPVSFAVDVSNDRAWCSIAAAGACRDGGIAVEVIEHRPGTGWVAARLAQLEHDHHPKVIVLDPRSATGALLDPRNDPKAPPTIGGVKVRLSDTKDRIQADGGFFDAVVEHTVSHRADPVLDAAVAGASQRPVGDAWLWNRRGEAVISPLVAVCLARWGHLLPAEDEPTKGPSDFIVI